MSIHLCENERCSLAEKCKRFVAYRFAPADAVYDIFEPREEEDGYVYCAAFLPAPPKEQVPPKFPDEFFEHAKKPERAEPLDRNETLKKMMGGN